LEEEKEKELQKLYDEELKLLRKLMYTNDKKQQRLIKTQISWLNVMMEKNEENENP